jgi:hypothetical protein
MAADPRHKLRLARAAVVQEDGARAQVPEGRRAHLAAERIAIGNAVGKRAHVVKQEVAVGADDAVAQRGLERWQIRCGELAGVALHAADGAEDRLPCHAAARRLRRRREVALKVCHGVDECRAEGIGLVLDLRNGVAVGEERGIAAWRRLEREQRVGQAHLVARGVGREVAHDGNLRLPAEAPCTERPRRVGERVHEVHTTRDAVGVGVVRIGERDERRIGNRLDQSEGEHARSHAVAHMVGDRWRRERLDARGRDPLPLQHGAAELLEEVEDSA